MSRIAGSHEHPSESDRQRLKTVATTAPDGEWLVPVASATVVLVRNRLAGARRVEDSAATTDPVRFVQEAYADLQELAWDRHVADDSALNQFSDGRVPQIPWSDFMKHRIVELSQHSTAGGDDDLRSELIQLCLVLLFFHSCRHRHDTDGVEEALELFEAFLGPARSRGDFPTYDVMAFYVLCMSFERYMLGRGIDVPCPTADRAKRIVDRNRESNAPTQAEETVLSAIARVANVGTAVARDAVVGADTQGHRQDLDELVEYGLELVVASRERGLRYFTAQSASQLHAWRGDTSEALKNALDAVRHSSAQSLAFWMPEVMKLRNFVAEANRDAHLDQVRAEFDERLREVEDRLEAKVSELSDQLEKEAREASDDASRRAIVPVIEVLGVFVAVLAVAVSTVGAAVASGLEFWQRIAVITAGSLGALLVLGMVRLQVRPGRRSKS